MPEDQPLTASSCPTQLQATSKCTLTSSNLERRTACQAALAEEKVAVAEEAAEVVAGEVAGQACHHGEVAKEPWYCIVGFIVCV